MALLQLARHLSVQKMLSAGWQNGRMPPVLVVVVPAPSPPPPLPMPASAPARSRQLALTAAGALPPPIAGSGF
jgi:hypothetical protein